MGTQTRSASRSRRQRESSPQVRIRFDGQREPLQSHTKDAISRIQIEQKITNNPFHCFDIEHIASHYCPIMHCLTIGTVLNIVRTAKKSQLGVDYHRR